MKLKSIDILVDDSDYIHLNDEDTKVWPLGDEMSSK